MAAINTLAATGPACESSIPIRVRPMTRRVTMDVYPSTPNDPPVGKKLKTENRAFIA